MITNWFAEASGCAIEAYDAAVAQQKAADQRKAAADALVFQALAPPTVLAERPANNLHAASFR
jgi:hypothetical protein